MHKINYTGYNKNINDLRYRNLEINVDIANISTNFKRIMPFICCEATIKISCDEVKLNIFASMCLWLSMMLLNVWIGWHDDVIKWKLFPCYWPFVRGINSSVNGEFPTQRPVTRSFDVFYDLRLNKRFSKLWRGWWFETRSCTLWSHCNDVIRNGHWNVKKSHGITSIHYNESYLID